MPSLKTKITTPLLTTTRDFYQTVFGLVVVEEWDEPDDRGVILTFPAGEKEALLEIYHGDLEPDFSSLGLQFRVADATEFLNGLPSDVPYEGPAERPWGSSYLYLRDPNGIQVIVYSGGW